MVLKFTVHKEKKNIKNLLKHKFLVPFSNRSEVESINIHFLLQDDSDSADPMTILWVVLTYPGTYEWDQES